MLMPAKHISFAESLLGFGSFILEKVVEPITLDQLWRAFERESSKYPAYQSFDNMLLALDALYAFGAIDLNAHGEIVRLRKDVVSCA
ncbi:ABC-three component system middle component 6 [Pseudomonas sp. GD03944]|uniref:ABC-three component system middle component 6 n=1 Tax=Pseudomonas sp. GD03944 TaxID=2975409 RepID=UPI00244B29DE|nr:ABC-three component system middle component 6 [Pseudomonas sp. GD03944]MDH1264665.1 hypothetical protein [Pseudomonas sp. GD03944]